MSSTPYLEDQLLHVEDDRRFVWIIATCVCLTLAWICVILRFTARWLSAMKYGADDWAIIPAAILTTIAIVDLLMGIKFGGGRHMVLMLQQPEMVVSYAKNTIVAEVLLLPTIMSIKIAVLLLYRRIFPSKRFHMIIWVVIGFVGSYTLASVLVAVLQCRPLSFYWAPVGDGYCIDIVSALTVLGSLNVCTDVIILALPIPLIWKLRTTTATKIQIIGLFLTGALVTITSIGRIVSLNKMNVLDATWSMTDTAAWSIAELGTALISACLPTFRPLFDKTKRKTGATVHSSMGRQSYMRTEDEQPLKNIFIKTSIENVWSSEESGDNSSRRGS